MTITMADKQQTEQSLVVRRLNTGDIFTLFTLMSSSLGDAKQIEQLFTNTASNLVDVTAIGINTVYRLVTGLMAENRDGLMKWLGSLVNKTAAEFEALPPTTTIAVVQALAEHEDLTDFFAQCSEVWAQFTGNTPESMEPETPANLSPAITTPSPADTVGPTTQ